MNFPVFLYNSIISLSSPSGITLDKYNLINTLSLSLRIQNIIFPGIELLVERGAWMFCTPQNGMHLCIIILYC